MKSIHIFLYTALIGLGVQSCKPKMAKDKDLPSPNMASMSYNNYLASSDPDYANAYIFTDNTEGGFISSWDFGGVKKSVKPTDTVFFAYAGTYKIKLISASKGGTSEILKDISVPSTSPFAADFKLEKLDANHFKLDVTTPNTIKSNFLYSNGVNVSGTADIAYFPWAGKYAIALTTVTKKGTVSITSTKIDTIIVDTDDANNPALSDPVFNLLTGGLAAANGKTWIMVQKPKTGGVGPYATLTADWYNQPDGFYGAAWESGMASNEFTFKMKGYQYIPKNQNVTAHWAFANKYFNKSQAQYADVQYVDPNHKQTPFILTKTPGTPGLAGSLGYTLQFTNGSYLGYFDNRYVHEIIRLDADTMYIRHKYDDVPKSDPKNDGGVRYFTFVSKK